jgi:hypothetical protein
MRQPFGLQEWIHKIEEGEGAKIVRIVFVLLLFCAVATLWHLREAKNFGAIEAMDAAQVARNLAEGNGYTTDFIRPFSLALYERAHGGEMAILHHPDLANAPGYPALLAGAMKLLPMKWDIPAEAAFTRYQPEVLIGIVNQALFFILILQLFFLSRRLFDRAVAWMGAIILALTEQMWEFTTSGLSTLLVMVLFLGLVEILSRIEQGSREPRRGKGYILILSAAAGLMAGLLCLTRYSMGWLMIPAVVFLAVFATGNRAGSAILAIVVFAGVLSPWLARNYSQSQTLFGTAGYAVYQQTSIFPDDRLERSMPKDLALELNKTDMHDFTRKLVEQGTIIFNKAIPELGGSWTWMFFLVGVMVPFINPTLSRLRYFLIGSFILFAIVQALGVTELSDLSPAINSENLLVVFLPLLIMFGASFFFILLDQLQAPTVGVRNAIIGAFILLLSLPFVLMLLPPREYPVNYPPYYPPNIQQVAHWMEPEELMMSDMPWAVGWYGHRKSVLITLDAGVKKDDDFYRINDFGKPIKAIYLTPVTTNAKYLTEMLRSPNAIWSRFYLDAVVKKNLPTGFPLTMGPSSILPDQLFLSDRRRWPKE